MNIIETELVPCARVVAHAFTVSVAILTALFLSFEFDEEKLKYSKIAEESIAGCVIV